MKRLIIFLGFIVISKIVPAQLLVTNLRCEYRTDPIGVDVAQPMLSWEIISIHQNVVQTAYHIIVADDEALLEKDTGNIWDSKKVYSRSSIQVPYKGKKLLPGEKYFWKVRVWDNKGNVAGWSKTIRPGHGTAYWQMGLPTAADWQGAKWIAYDVLPDSNIIVPFAHGRGKREWGSRKNILPLFRKTFGIVKPVKRATAFICGLGHFQMSVNGKTAGNNFLDPGWTQYNKHALYVGLDITDLVEPGGNVIGVILGNGFYYIPGERYRKLTGAYGHPKMIARIIIEYEDGSTTSIVSDASWKATPSPITFSSIYGGEDYDAGREEDGWNTTWFQDLHWKHAVITTGPALNAQMTEPLRVMQRFNPQKKNELRPGVTIYDLGQNFSGIPSITVEGKEGDTVRIIPAELINEDGSANQRGSGGPSFFNYILKGNEKEYWQPRFTYYGFRYLQVHCIPKDSGTVKPRVLSIEGLHVRNVAPTSGTFITSHELFNKTFDLINWAIRSNTVSVFTDCPHREKLGWLEQTHLMGSSVQYNYDIAALNRKVIRDMIHAQTPDGLVPEIAPEYVQFEDPFRDSPEWGSAAIILPWDTYKWYGDKQILQEAYPMMKKYIGYLQKKSVNHILSHGLGDWYDIGPNRPGFSQLTPAGVTATAVYYFDLNMMADIAKLLGKTADEKQYRSLAVSVRQAFNNKFFNKNTFQYASGSQTANAMALYMKLVEPKYKDAVVANLVKDIRDRNNALTAGDIGYRFVLRALEDAGRSDIIYDMNSRNDVPGYGYQLAHGATALTESWQALPAVSNNHFMLGHLMEWFYAGLCGIKQAAGSVAYERIVIRPQPVGEVMDAEAIYNTPYGLVSSRWTRKNDGIEFEFIIPVNTTAEIYLPGRKVIKTGSGVYKYSIKSN